MVKVTSKKIETGLALGIGETHIWYSDIHMVASSGMLSCYTLLLNSDERSRLEQLCDDKVRCQYLVARALLRSTLTLYFPLVSETDWQFSTNAYGKPYITNVGYEDVFFNLSHTEKMVVLAIAHKQEVGIDIEHLDTSIDCMEVASAFFHPDEIERLNVPTPELKTKHFIQMWTLKEAYVKARGKGLSLPLNSFAVDLTLPYKLVNHGTNGAVTKYWHFWQKQLEHRHIVAMVQASEETCFIPQVKIRKSIPQLQARQPYAVD